MNCRRCFNFSKERILQRLERERVGFHLQIAIEWVSVCSSLFVFAGTDFYYFLFYFILIENILKYNFKKIKILF